jgi:PAS domain S-box-containing protein
MNAEVRFARQGPRLWGPPLMALAAIGLQIVARPLIDENYLLLLFPAIAFGTLFGEVTSTIVATLIGLIGVWFLFVPPTGPSGIEHHDVFALVVFGFTGVLLAVVTARLRKAASVAETARLNLERHAYMARLLRSNPVVMALSRADDGTILDVNPSWERLLGFSRDEVIGRSSREIGISTDPVAHESVLGQMSSSGTIRSLQARVRTKSGEVRDVLLSADALDVDGKPCVLSALQDVTDLKRAEAHERDNDLKFRLLLQTAAQGILAVDAGGIIRIANPASEAMFGYGAGELVGQPVDMLVPPGLRERHAGHRATYMTAPRTRAMGTGLELVASRKDRSTFPVEVSLSHVATAEGGLVVVFITDITERKTAADALRDRELALRALTARILTAQEDERRRVARELHDDVTQRLATLSIELGALTSQGVEAGDDLRARLRAAQRRVIQMSEDVRRVAHALHPAMLEDLGLGTALKALCEEQSEIHRVAIRFDGEEPRDSGIDPARAASLYRLAQEAIANAVQHGHATAIDVALRTGPDTVQLEVRDNGVGFDGNAPKARAGLGMTSMRERVNLEHGTLTVQSKPGQGTLVTAIVPLSEAAAL